MYAQHLEKLSGSIECSLNKTEQKKVASTIWRENRFCKSITKAFQIYGTAASGKNNQDQLVSSCFNN